MKKFAFLILVIAIVASIAPSFAQRPAYDLEAVFNQGGEFRGCPYSGGDCRRI